MTTTQSNPIKLNVNWETYDQLVTRLANDIKKSGFDFDQIVCIARGGMFVGDPMSRLFNKPLAVIFTSSYSNENKQNTLIVSKQIAMTTDNLAKKVLLVDDLVDSGDTIDAVKKLLESKYKVEEVRTAVLWKKTCSKFKPDYFVEETKANVWINQPFEKFDNVKLD